jgi:hypothetical protein
MPSSSVPLTSDQVRLLRLRAQHLAQPAPREALLDVVGDVMGIQAQMPSAAALSLRARVAGLTSEDLHQALEVHRSLVRTWVMRGTIHVIRTEDLPWMLAALPPSVLPDVPRWLERRAGLSRSRTAAAASKVERLLLQRGPMTRGKIVEAVGLGPEAGYGLMRLAALKGRICYGPDRGSEQTYVAVRDWLPALPPLGPPPPGELARRYLAGYGPAEPADLAAWWGMPLGRAREELRALGTRSREVTHHGRNLSVLAGTLDDRSSPTGGPVRLVGAWDTYLLGHRDRDLIISPAHAGRVNRGGGWVHPVVLVGGRVGGVWRLERRSGKARVEVEAFGPIPRPGLREEAEDVGRFLGLPVELTVTR